VGPLGVISVVYQLCAPVVLVTGLIVYLVRTSSENAATAKMSALADKIDNQVGALKNTLAAINTALGIAEERHRSLAIAQDKFDERLGKLEESLCHRA
jgi:hypothetical protein